MSRPELELPPELYYDETEALKYTNNTRIIEIQRQLTSRALEILCLPEGKSAFLLDVGCGSGLSCQVLEEAGHFCIGCDISPHMLKVAKNNEVFSDLILRDIGDALPFRPGVFDGVISISVIQWLCYSNSKNEVPSKRLTKFFHSLYMCMKDGSRAVFQFYPENNEQIEFILLHATKCGFGGGLLVDYPESTKAKKYYLCLFVGQSKIDLPTPLTGTNEATFEKRNTLKKYGKKVDKITKGSRDWVLKKKERQRKQGREVRPDSKYTGRRRRDRF